MYLWTQHVLAHLCSIKDGKNVGIRMACDEVSYLEEGFVPHLC